MSRIDELEKIIDKPFRQYERETVESCFFIEIKRRKDYGPFSTQERRLLMDHFDSMIKGRVRGSILLSMNASIIFSKNNFKCSYFITAQGRSQGDFMWISHIINCPNVNNFEVRKWEIWDNIEFFSMARRKLCQCEGAIAQHIMLETTSG